MEKVILFILCILLIFGCSQKSTFTYYEGIDAEGNLYGKNQGNWFKEYYSYKTGKYDFERNYKGSMLLLDRQQSHNVYREEYCVYSIFFLPLNFWNINKSNAEYVKKTIKDANNKGIIGDTMHDIFFWTNKSQLMLTFWVTCNQISGNIV